MFIHDWTTILNIYVENEGKTLDFKQINISLTKMFILRCLELLCGRCHYPCLLRRRWETQFLFTFSTKKTLVIWLSHIYSTTPHLLVKFHSFFISHVHPSYDCNHYDDQRIFTNLFFVQRRHHTHQINLSKGIFLLLILYFVRLKKSQFWRWNFLTGNPLLVFANL